MPTGAVPAPCVGVPGKMSTGTIAETRIAARRGKRRGRFIPLTLPVLKRSPSDIFRQPGVHGPGILEKLHERVLGLPRAQPRLHRPLLPGDETFVSKEFDPG